MRNGFRILDADRHVIEPVQLWRERLPQEFRSRAPYWEAPSEPVDERIARLGSRGLVPRWPTLMIDGQPARQKLTEQAEIELTLACLDRMIDTVDGMTPGGHIRAMDRTGVDVAFLYPTYAMWLVGIDSLDPVLASAIARAYNEWLKEFCDTAPDRLRGVGLISCHEPEQMVEEVDRIHDFGWRAVVLRPNPVHGRMLGHSAYTPFWEKCAQLGVAVAIHEGTHSRLPTAGADRFESRFAQHACSHPMEQMMAFLSLLEGGTLERFPQLRLAFLEAGCGWVPYWLWRLDHIEYRHLSAELEGRIKSEPSVYFTRQCFVGFEPDEPYLDTVLTHVGRDQLVFGTDFPHLDHNGEQIVEQSLHLERKLGVEVLRKLLWDNGARFYGEL